MTILVIKHFCLRFLLRGDQLEFALLHNGVVILSIMASACGTRRARYHGQTDLHVSPQNVFLFPYSIVVGDYYSGDARYLVVNDYLMLQLLLVTNW